jgi:hypothetical protein
MLHGTNCSSWNNTPYIRMQHDLPDILTMKQYKLRVCFYSLLKTCTSNKVLPFGAREPNTWQHIEGTPTDA